MFLKVTRSGPRRYLQLIEAYRDTETGQPKQRHVATLGRLDRLADGELDGLIDGLLKASGRAGLADPAVWVDRAKVRFEPSREVGPVWVLWQLWLQLKLPAVLQQRLGRGRRRLNLEPLVRAMVFNRLCEPCSKLGVMSWLERVLLPVFEPAQVSHQNLLRAMDALLSHKNAVERHLAAQLPTGTLEVVCYDITTVRIHGQGEQAGEELRRWGHSKDVAGVDRQFAVGLVQTAEGFPLAHEVFAGNIGEKTTVRGMVRELCRRFPIHRLIVVADRGMLSLDHLSELEGLQVAGGQAVEYIVAVPARRCQQLTAALVPLHAALIQASRGGEAEVIREAATDDGRRLVVAYSSANAKHSRRVRARRLRPVLHLARRLERRLEAQERGTGGRGRRLTEAGAKAQLYRAVLEQRVSAWITVHLEAPGYSWSWNLDAFKQALHWDGKRVLISNVPQFEAAALIRRYKELADIERGFRILKSQLDIAPVYHRLPDRLRAHTFICFLALVLQRLLRHRLRQHAAGLSPETVLERLRAVQYHQVRLPNGQRLANLTQLTPARRHLFNSVDVEVPLAQAFENA
jgi:transposase